MCMPGVCRSQLRSATSTRTITITDAETLAPLNDILQKAGQAANGQAALFIVAMIEHQKIVNAPWF